MTATDPTYPNLGLGEILRVLRRRWLRVLITTVVVGGLVLGLTISQAKKYRATAVLLVKTADASTAAQADPNAQAPNYAARQQMNAQYYLESSAQRDAVRAQYHGPLNVNSVSATAINDGSDAIDISVTGPNPKEAADLVNLYANVYINNTNASILATLKKSGTTLLQTIATLKAEQQQISAPLVALQVKQATQPSNVALEAQIQSLSAQISPTLSTIDGQIATDTLQLQNIWATAGLTGEESASLTTAATPPKSPVSPKPVRNGAIGVVLGLGLGIALALGKEFMRQPTTVVELADTPVPAPGRTAPVSRPVSATSDADLEDDLDDDLDDEFEPEPEVAPAFAARRARRRDEAGEPFLPKRGGLVAGDTGWA